MAQGGQRPGMEMYKKFRGEEPDKTPMLRARGLWKEPEPVEETKVEEPKKEAPKSLFNQQPAQPTKPGQRPAIEPAKKADKAIKADVAPVAPKRVEAVEKK